MKRWIVIAAALISTLGMVDARPQKERLMNAYKAEGEKLYYLLYWHPNTEKTFKKHINCDNWAGFESGYFDEVAEEKRVALLDALGAELDKMDREKQIAWWKQLRDWQHIHEQLTMLAIFMNPDSEVEFIEFAFKDPTLRPGFQWILDSRGPNFDPEHVGATLASGERVSVFPNLVQHLITVPEKERLECFGRMFARMAKQRPAVAE